MYGIDANLFWRTVVTVLMRPNALLANNRTGLTGFRLNPCTRALLVKNTQQGRARGLHGGLFSGARQIAGARRFSVRDSSEYRPRA